VIAATVIGEAGDVSRFAGKDAFAAYNGTAPIEVSSGKRWPAGCRSAGTGG
jgi:transposase